jgi:hypothetical protein
MTLSRFIASLGLLLCLALAAVSGTRQEEPITAEEIVHRSVEANQRDWKQLPDYDYYVREYDEDGGTKTYLSQMLVGTRYNQLVAINEKPLAAADAAAERGRLESELKRRQHESPEERKQRIAKYQKEQDRNEFFLKQLGDAFDFNLSGRDTVVGHEVYVLTAKPRRGYRPPTAQAKALTGMEGTLWVDSKDFHWVKVQAKVVHPVSIEGFLARVERGTRFELDQAPVAEGLWLPSRFVMVSRAKVLFFFSHNDRDDEAYFDYHRATTSAK